ncbi:MAG TPA: ATP-binding cassette domain-containing protein [Polyangiaceae bacterium]|nr:ATP-binding cassette domain-containing protein [Polyangiaceae bacterium]
MIEVQHLTKLYGAVRAVDDLSFSVGAGEVVGFLGPNGAGKSTTLRILAGFLGATSGLVRIDGHDVERAPIEAKRKIGYMPESAPLYPELRVQEYLAFRVALKGVPRRERKAAVQSAMANAHVVDVSETLIGHLSKGYRQRVALADALLGSPPLLILDEPTVGLDPNQIREVRHLIRELGQTHTILLSTHILSEVEATCDRAIVVSRGHLVAEGRLAELAKLGKSQSLRAELRDPRGCARELAANIEAVLSVEDVSASSASEVPSKDAVITLHIVVREGPESVAERLCAEWVRAGVFVRRIEPVQASLEQVFAELTASEKSAPEAA